MAIAYFDCSRVMIFSILELILEDARRDCEAVCAMGSEAVG